MQKLNLPEPTEEEKQHSAQLLELIRNEIDQAGGWIDFSHYMTLALYAPGLGYYSAGKQKFGEQGDFITAPEVSPLFAQTLANAVSQVLASLASPNVIEFGAGSGKLAADLLSALNDKDALPEKYYIVELSAELKQRQQQTLKEKAAKYLDRVIWLDKLPDEKLPDEKLNAVVLANEVLDAMPVQRFVKHKNNISCLGVSVEDKVLVLRSLDEVIAESRDGKPGFRDASSGLRDIQKNVEAIEAYINHKFANHYTSEINLNIKPWLQSVADVIDQGAVYIIDYGYPKKEYYLPERYMGTMMCYYQHRAHENALWYPGLQDITAFVDFTAVAEAAIEVGFDVNGYTSQANFLLNSGLSQIVEKKMSDDSKEQLKLAQQVKTLTLPSEMGERFKVVGLNKNLDMLLPGFEINDMRNRL